MAEITQDERKEGLGLANRVDELAMTAPDVFAERVLHAASHRLRKRYGYSKELKKTEILRRVKKEPLGVTLTDLKKELGFQKNDVYTLVKELRQESKLDCKKVQPAGSRGGRPILLITAM